MLHCYVGTPAAAIELYHVIRRILTALIHTVNTAEQFSPFTNVVIDTFKSVVASSAEKTTKVLPVVVTICSVRHGSRLTRKSYRCSVYASPLIPTDSITAERGDRDSQQRHTDRGEPHTTPAVVDFRAHCRRQSVLGDRGQRNHREELGNGHLFCD